MFKSAYLEEFRRNWQVLLASALALSGGGVITLNSQAVFAPRLLSEFGWTQSQFALLTLTTIPVLLFVPIVGRLTDVFGPLRVMLPTVVLFPFSWLCFLLIDGTFTAYLAMMVVHMFVGIGTASYVVGRVIAQHFLLARGLALSIMMSGPSAAVAIGAPQLTRLLAAFGWQSGYVAMAAYSAVVGGMAYLLLRRHTPLVPQEAAEKRARRTWNDYAAVLGSRPFWIIFFAMVLCNIPNLIHSAQMNLVLIDRGVSLQEAAQIISLFAIGVIVGRFACGIAIDRLPIVPVAMTALGLPALGLFLLASGVGGFWTMAFAMALVGLAQGAEGELAAMLSLKHFQLDNFSTAYSLLTVNSALATAIGSLTLSGFLSIDNRFTGFLLFGAATTLAGSLMLALLPRERSPMAFAKP